jgi:predicted AlkP superfamily phosphohydrolase/phosphomutase
MRTEPWDLFLLCFAATHRAGHQLWDRTSLRGDSTDGELAEFDDALRQVYMAADKAVGEMIDCAGEETAVLVFALHGMEVNRSRTILTSEMLSRVLSGPDRSQMQARLPRLDRMRNAVPVRWRSVVKNRLPIFLQDWLSVFWRLRGIDWNTVRAFAQFGDLDAYVRVNLRGREAQGIVEPGQEYADLCKQIADGFRTFVDEDTGECVVEDIEFSQELFPDGAHRDSLPDLIVHWAKPSAARHRRIVSADFGAIDWPTPGHHPQGRSGDHARSGFLLSRGFETTAAGEDASILDLAPTIYDLLGKERPGEFQGRSLLARSR